MLCVSAYIPDDEWTDDDDAAASRDLERMFIVPRPVGLAAFSWRPNWMLTPRLYHYPQLESVPPRRVS